MLHSTLHPQHPRTTQQHRDTTALVAGFRAAFAGAAGIALVAAALAAVALRRPATVATVATGAPAAQPGD